ncbi:MAG: hypothetical protein QXP42_05960 [Candidatus Micrarchaeia archaeon]
MMNNAVRLGLFGGVFSSFLLFASLVLSLMPRIGPLVACVSGLPLLSMLIFTYIAVGVLVCKSYNLKNVGDVAKLSAVSGALCGITSVASLFILSLVLSLVLGIPLRNPVITGVDPLVSYALCMPASLAVAVSLAVVGGMICFFAKQ